MSFSPRKIQTLFLAVTLLFAGALGWLGWRLVQQDRALARQRRVEQLEAAADRVSAAVYRRLADFEEALADPVHGRLPAGAVLLRASREGIEARPPNGLLYYPAVPASPEPPPGVFSKAETAEFQRNDPAAAAEAYRPLTRSADPAVRAAALLGLARNLAKSNRASEALRAFDQLAAMGAARVGGLPADLVALEARCSLLEKLARHADLDREAHVLYAKLTDGHWLLLRASYDFKLEEARGWLGRAPDPAQLEERAAPSAAAGTLWNDWLREPVSKGRRFFIAEGPPVLAAWVSSAQELTAVLAPAAALAPALGEADGFHARMISGYRRAAIGSMLLRSPGNSSPLQ
jgi:hypothetical protein